MAQQLSLPFLSNLGGGHITARKRFLDKLSRHIDFEAFRERLRSFFNYGRYGRPHYDVVLMFKILVLQSCYGLSDDSMQDAIIDSNAFQHFLGLGCADRVPDSRTIRNFRLGLGAEGVRSLFDDFNGRLVGMGTKVSKGTIIDSSFVEAPKQRNTPEENRQIKEEGKTPEEWSEKKTRHKDKDARWTKKGGERHYGYKNHAAVDLRTGLVENWTVTPANVHDSQVCEELINEGKNHVFADSAYNSEENRQALKKRKVNPAFIKRRYRGQPDLTEQEKEANRKLSSKRCRIEHVFGAMKQMGGDIVRSIGLARCIIRVGLVNLAYNMKRVCFLIESGQLCLRKAS